MKQTLQNQVSASGHTKLFTRKYSMMKALCETLLIAVFLFNTTHSYAGQKSQTLLDVKWIETAWNKDGLVIAFNQNPIFSSGIPNCTWKNSVIVPDSHPMLREIMSIALTAQATGTQVQVYVEDACIGNRAELISIQQW